MVDFVEDHKELYDKTQRQVQGQDWERLPV